MDICYSRKIQQHVVKKLAVPFFSRLRRSFCYFYRSTYPFNNILSEQGKELHHVYNPASGNKVLSRPPPPKYGTYIYHRIANVMRIKNIPYVGGLRQTGPPQEVSKNGTPRKFSKSLGLSQILVGTQTYGYVI